MYLIGYDIGSSSVKASLICAETGQCAASAFYPKTEAEIIAHKTGWAEQAPESWWTYLKQATQEIMAGVPADEVGAIGISYQMHGLVCVDKELKPLRHSIIWCDSRAVRYGQRAFKALGEDYCLNHYLNSPGNFTVSKLAWVKEHEPQLFERIYKVMLPGDYIGMRLTGEVCSTVSGMSEAIAWDFKEHRPAHRLLEYFGFSEDILPELRPTFGEQGRVTDTAAAELGLKAGIPVTYRAGDQPNNALSLAVLNPGEIASTAGTSGVVYGVNDKLNYDPLSRVNIFAHVNHEPEKPRLGVLLCINGTGILNSWIRKNMAPVGTKYAEMDALVEQIPIGSEGISVLPFGNGAERLLQNAETGCSMHGINFNVHSRSHLLRAAQEGVVFSFKYGIEIMQQMGLEVKKIHAGKANMFHSPVFRQTLASITGATLELYDTDGSVGAARGAGIGAGIYKSAQEAFNNLNRLAVIEPDVPHLAQYQEAYERWKHLLEKTDFLS